MSEIFNPQEKILCHIGTIKEYFEGKNPDPVTLEIDPSNACNHSCPFCISGHIHLQKYKGTELFNRTIMPKIIFEKLVRDLVNTNIKAINWTGGGEPTLNPFLGEAISFIKSNSKIEMGMFSNGSMLDKFNLFDVLAKSLSWIRISIDAGKASSYNNLRKTNKNNDFNTVITNIKKLIKRKKELKSKMVIGVGFVVTEQNYHEIKDFSKLFKDVKVDYCQFKPEIIQIERVHEKFSKNSNGMLQISSDFWLKKVVHLLDEAKSILGKKFECNSYKIEDLIVDVKNYGRNYKECIGSQFQPCIGADGHVYVCTNHRGHKQYSYGSIYERTFSEIWSDIKKRKQIMDVINKKEKFSKCTHLCKPHESNKILHLIKENLKEKNYIDNIQNQTKLLRKNLKHINFI
jgi:radical SAM protein with 4Fe4S-binding SPASM domain